MALVTAVGRSSKIVYGQPATFSFFIKDLPDYSVGAGGVEYINGQLNSVGYDIVTNVAGTVVVSNLYNGSDYTGSVTVTLSPAQARAGLSGGIAQAFFEAQGAFQAVGWDVALNPTQVGGVSLIYTTTSPTNNTGGGVLTTKPTVALGTATGFFFTDISWFPGTSLPIAGVSITGATWSAGTATLTFATQTFTPSMVGTFISITGISPSGYNTPAGGSLITKVTRTSISYFVASDPGSYSSGGTIATMYFDDIYIQGRTPVTVTLIGTGASLQGSTGTLQEQQLGLLKYQTAFTLTLGTPSVPSTTSYNFVRVATTGTAQISLYITR